MCARRLEFTAIDLFAGAGGLTEGLKQAGFKVLGAVEIDALATETYRMNHPRVRMWHTDIMRLSGADVRRTLRLKKGQLDLSAGCPPCQGFSAMRTLNGGREVRDDRNDLIFQFLRLVEQLEPKSIMMENVPGLMADDRMRRVRRALIKLGYHVDCRILDAADYGVPQRRRRMILLAARSTSIRVTPKQSGRKTVHDAIHHLPRAGNSGDPLHDLPERRSAAVMAIIRDIPHDGGSRADLGEERQLPCHLACGGFKDVYGRLRWRDVSSTITTGCFNPSKGRFLHPEEDRNITLREAALLQTFPRDYRFSLRRGKTNAAVLIGNALPPTFIKVQALKIMKTLRGSSRCRVAPHLRVRGASL